MAQGAQASAAGPVRSQILPDRCSRTRRTVRRSDRKTQAPFEARLGDVPASAQVSFAALAHFGHRSAPRSMVETGGSLRGAKPKQTRVHGDGIRPLALTLVRLSLPDSPLALRPRGRRSSCRRCDTSRRNVTSPPTPQSGARTLNGLAVTLAWIDATYVLAGQHQAD